MLQQQKIPYFDHDEKSLWQTICNASTRRDVTPLKFICRKIRNIILFRLSYMCPLNGWRVKMHRWRGCHIGKNTYIGIQCNLDNAYPEYIYIGDNVSLAGEVTIIAHSNPYPHFEPIIESKVSSVIVKDGAWIGAKSILLSGVVVGENSIVSAATVVDKNVPDYSIAKGNPMKIVAEYREMFDK